MKTLKQKIEVMQAALDGEEIEGRFNSFDDEWTVQIDPVFNWVSMDYRIKPEPLEFWLVIYDDDSIEGEMFKTKSDAMKYSMLQEDEWKVIKVREVIE